MTAERLVTKHSRGMARREWVKAPSARNEALDATVYAYAAAVYAGLKRANWAALKRRVLPAAVVVKDAPESAPAVARPSVFPGRRPGGFVKGWKNG